ncbi:alpha/beta fold hydrolase [Ktedonosporobacter rubrisoli]|uniref:Alpha/beta fold hydrolase n=1 Tax=Ktedonosporobacter rubrisoli TaxID=2509675 RepID=A0A4P6JUY8_KTERU|nr:alpha/beta fold hydrolase [Ktedonosporobacter rubrisoli]QBD79140.1 alpha/beta fold hydrolase [Ktedonosporobacter rubrisoli]
METPSEYSIAATQSQLANKQPAAIGVLLVHGFNADQHDMEDLAHAFASQGLLTENLLLPGHGTHVREMFSSGWPEWACAVKTALQRLQERCAAVFLIGHSLGGSLCLHVAAQENVAGIVTICAPVRMYPWMQLAVHLAKYLTPLLPTLREDICDPKAHRRYQSRGYRWTPTAPVASMLEFLPQLRAELPTITAPVLIMVAHHDHVVPACDGSEIYRLLGSQDKHLITFYRSFHVIMKDHDREEVYARARDFILSHSATMQVQQKIQ